MYEERRLSSEEQKTKILEHLEEASSSNNSLTECLEIAMNNRELEIKLFWKRSNLFWLFVAAIFIAIAYVKRTDSPIFFPLALSIVGTMFSFIWCLVNRASKSWQESWEIKVETYSEKLYKNKNIFKRAAHNMPDLTLYNVLHYKPLKYSVSKLLMALSDYVFIFWSSYTLYLLYKVIIRSLLPPPLAETFVPNLLILLFALFTFGYMVLVLCRCQSGDDLITKELETSQLQKNDDQTLARDHD